METQPTNAINTKGFQPITQQDGTGETIYTSSNENNDRFGVRYLPTLFQYLEEHFSFASSFLSIVGYVIIASFGQMQSVGQYVGYIIFLGLILFAYSSDKKDKVWKYLFIAIFIILISFISFTYWTKIKELYHLINTMFSLKLSK